MVRYGEDVEVGVGGGEVWVDGEVLGMWFGVGAVGFVVWDTTNDCLYLFTIMQN